MKRSRVFLGVSTISLSVLMLQLTLTRLFSATMYYHFAFMAISLALFGAGAGGVFVYLAPSRLRHDRAARWLTVFGLLFAAATVFALLVILANPLSPIDPVRATLGHLTWIYGATALPFFFAGTAIALAVTCYAREMSRLYLFDLGGAAVGCLLLIPLLDRLGAVNTVLMVAVLAGTASILFASAAEDSRRAMALPLLFSLALLGLLVANRINRWAELTSAKGLKETGNVVFAKWNSFSRVTVWGRMVDTSLLILIDADAGTRIMRDAAESSRFGDLAKRVESLAYHLRPDGDALVIGAGGGLDVVTARLFGARSITAVEVNPIIARDVMSSEPFRSYSGRLYEQPGVRLVIDEARSFIRGSTESYDVIQATMVDTWAATAAGAFALTENNLYTVEAFRDYLNRLSPSGILSFTRWYFEPPDQVFRLAALARAALEERGVKDASGHLMIVASQREVGRWRAPATLLLKKTPFTDEEVQAVEGVAARFGFYLLYTPRTRPRGTLKRLIEAEHPEDVWFSLAHDVSPPRDDRPFFFHTVRVSHLGDALSGGEEWAKTNLGSFVVIALFGISLALTVAFVLLPLVVARGRALAGHTAQKLAWLLYFAGLGAGYIVVEVVLVQKCILFLGPPVYSLSVVLFTLLGMSGLGSLMSGRLSEGQLERWLGRMLLIVVALIVLAALGLSPLFYAFVQLSRPTRIAITIAALAPLGFALGMPMPTGIRILGRDHSEIVPWAWGVNGAASVLGTVAALAAALTAGFNAVLIGAAIIYLLCLAAVVAARRVAADQ